MEERRGRSKSVKRIRASASPMSLTTQASRSRSRSRSASRVGFPIRRIHEGNTGPEKKVLDTAYATYVCDTTGSVTLLTGIAQGDDFNQRDGRKIKITDVMIQGCVSAVDSVTDDVYCTVMLIYDRQSNQGAPTIADIFSAANSTAFMNLNNRERFKILSTDRVCLSRNNATATTAVGSCNQSIINRYIKTDLVTIFDGTGGAVTDITTGAVFLVTLGDVAAGSGGAYFASARVRFVDL